MNDKWLYQVRIRVNNAVSKNLRTNESTKTTESILAIAKNMEHVLFVPMTRFAITVLKPRQMALKNIHFMIGQNRR